MSTYLQTKMLVILTFFQFLFSSVFSQDSLSSSFALAEKVYLQMDNHIYTNVQTIWYKAIVASAGDHVPTLLSGVLYVELIDPAENIVERKLIKLEQGIGNGFFQLSPLYVVGIYQIRAYTEWDKNFESSFLFKEYVLIAGTANKSEPFDPIKKVTVKEGLQGERRVSVQMASSFSDSISGKELQFIALTKEKRDTISLKRNRSNEYILDYPVPAKCDVLTLQIANDNAINYAKTIVLDTNSIDLQFFPESGELVQGLTGILGVKALDYEGRGKKIDGDIVTAKGETVATFTTNNLGMGVVNIGHADSNAHYIAKTNSITNLPITLPAVAGKGNTLSVKKRENKIWIKASSNYLLEDSMIVRATCRGLMYFDFSGRMKNSDFEFSIDKNLLPEGIIAFTLLQKATMTPMAERLYFNERPDERLHLTVSTEKKEYTQREKTNVAISTSDKNGQPAVASMSVLAIHQAQGDQASSLHENILSHFLLSSDLRGEIERPGYYFQPDTDRSDDIDALLLTQGWRKYNYSKNAIAFRFLPEQNLTIAGNVKGGFSDNKIMKGAELTLMGFSNPPSFASGKTDSLGRFRFLLDDKYGDDMEVVIQSANKSNKKRSYLVTLDKKEPWPIEFTHALSIRKPDSVVQLYLQQSVERKKAEDAYRLAKEGAVLENVTVTARSLSPLQKEVTDRFGKPDVVITGKDIQAKEEKWSYGLYGVLLFQFGDKLKVTRYPNGHLYASLHNSEPTLVVIDGIAVKSYEYTLVPSIPPSEVKSVELIPYAKNFHALFCEAIYCGLNTPSVGNVIAIYTHAGKGLYGVKPPTGISKMTVPVFSTPREFYAPKYDQLKPDDWQKPDLRNVLHWAPNLSSDTTGKSTVSFYNSDQTGTVRLVIEAISTDGRIGYAELLYDVKRRNKD